MVVDIIIHIHYSCSCMYPCMNNHIGGCHVLMLAIVPSHVMLNGCSYMYMCSLLAIATLLNMHVYIYRSIQHFRDASVAS